MMGMVRSAQRQPHVLADQVLVALVFRMHGHGHVAEQGFRAGGGDDQMRRRRLPADSGCAT